MKTMKHVGRIKNTGDRVVVVFRTVPGESNQALVLQPSTLPDAYHDSLMTVLESDQGQESFEFGEIMFTRSFPDGRNMLVAMEKAGRLKKVSTDQIMMTPTPVSEIALDQLNVAIAEQKNCTVDELCTFVSGGPKVLESSTTVENEVPTQQSETSVLKADENNILSDKDLAKSYRSQADAMYKEAARLRKQADELDPPQKKVTKAKETADA
jgi:hypothetical protein